MARPRGVWAVAAPVMVQEMALVGTSALITLMAGRVSPGTVAAIGMIDALAQLLHAVLGVVAIGAAVTTAHTLGAGRRDDLPAVAASALALALAAGTAMVALLWLVREPLVRLCFTGAEAGVVQQAGRYFFWVIVADPPTALVLAACAVLRSMGRAAVATRVNLAMNLVQIGMAALSMQVWQAAETGAGMALAGARWLGALLAVLALLGTLAQSPSGRAMAAWRPQRVHMHAMLRVGWPAAFETVFFHVGKLLTQALVAGLGTAALAANFIAFSVSSLLNIPGAALGVAASVRMGHRLGAGHTGAARRDLLKIWRSATVLTCLIALVVLPGARSLAALYTRDPEVVRSAATLIALNCLFMPCWGASFVLPQGLRGAGDTLYTMAVAAASMWGCRILLGWLLGRVLGWGVAGVWLGMFADWACRGWLFWRRTTGSAWTRHSPVHSKR